MNRSFLFLLFVMTFSCSMEVQAATVACEEIEYDNWNEPTGLGTVRTCRMLTSTTIDEASTTISTNDAIILAITFYGNKNITRLPVEVAENFPNLLIYSAGECSIKEISKSNFNGLSKLKELSLATNQIEKISSDAFEDLIELEYLYLDDNKIKFIGDDVFKNLKKLSDVHLRLNPCINQNFNGKMKIASMPSIVKQKCGWSHENLHSYLETELTQAKVAMNRLEAQITKIMEADEKSKNQLSLKNDELMAENARLQNELSLQKVKTTEINTEKVQCQTQLETSNKYQQELKAQAEVVFSAKTDVLNKECELKLHQRQFVPNH